MTWVHLACNHTPKFNGEHVSRGGGMVRIQGGVARSHIHLPRALYEDFKSLLGTRLTRIN